MARVNYDVQLHELKNQMLSLGCMIEQVLNDTVRALVNQDDALAKKISGGDTVINAQVLKIEQECYSILLRQQPIAGDLRTVSAALKMITDMERIGDHGADISDLIVCMKKEVYPEFIDLIKGMAKETTLMLMNAVDAFDKENMDMATKVIEQDDVVDALFMDVKIAIAKGISESSVNAMQSLDLLMIAKYFERIGDHATNIAEWVQFSITGEFPKD